MPPRKELCRNFQRGSCQYGERCKFLHATQQQTKPNVSGFGLQTSTPFQRSNSQQQKPNPFGFGVQGSSQPRGSNDFGFKPFENKWTRFSPVNAGASQALRQPDNQLTTNHNCTDPESCKRQIIEDFEHERPIWKLTCYGHGKSSPCDIVGDVSYEELRAAAYDDAKRGLNLQSIVERERSLLNAKLLEFENLLRNPYAAHQSSAIGTHSTFPGASPSSSMIAQNGTPPSVSSFGQLGASLDMGSATSPNNAFGQPNSIQISSQTAGVFATNNSPFGSVGSLGSQLPVKSPGNFFASNTASFSNSAVSAERSVFPPSAVSPLIPNSASVQSPRLQNVSNSASNAVGQLSVNVDASISMPREDGALDDNIWLKEEWNPGEIPEEAPPDKYIL